ncbi:MAG: acyl--CoA ligase, partial [Verrucomicrobia bacterium]|nr:acyl--CoA ligase [Verrucomicrobiota bacterium]
MNDSPESNFATRLFERLGPNSQLIDAARGETISTSEIRASIRGTAAAFRSAGLQFGDRVLIGCSLSPASTLAYLGAMYAGLVPVPLEERVLQATGESICIQPVAKAVWTDRDVDCKWVNRPGVLHFRGTYIGSPESSLKPAPRRESDLAALMPTSGSTGVPRLVRVTH